MHYAFSELCTQLFPREGGGPLSSHWVPNTVVLGSTGLWGSCPEMSLRLNLYSGVLGTRSLECLGGGNTNSMKLAVGAEALLGLCHVHICPSQQPPHSQVWISFLFLESSSCPQILLGLVVPKRIWLGLTKLMELWKSQARWLCGGVCGGIGWGQSQIIPLPSLGFERCNTHKHSRLGSHDAPLLKWHLLPLSCLFRLSGSCHVRRAAPSLPLPHRCRLGHWPAWAGDLAWPLGHWGRGRAVCTAPGEPVWELRSLIFHFQGLAPRRR